MVFNLDVNNVDVDVMQKKLGEWNYSRALVMHKKNNCIFSINALKRLLTAEYGQDVFSNNKKGNVDNQAELCWKNYHNKLAMLNKQDMLVLQDIRFIRLLEECPQKPVYIYYDKTSEDF